MERLEAHGRLRLDEATWAASVVHGKVAHTGFHTRAYFTLATMVGTMLGLTIAGILSLFIPPTWMMAHPISVLFAMLVLAAFGTLWGVDRGWKRVAIVLDKAWREGLAKRGIPNEADVAYVLDERGLEYRTDNFTAVASYPSIHQIVRDEPYWIVGADALTLCLPDSAFASNDDATAFMRTLWDRIGEDAQERSKMASLSLGQA
ncbi:hypothetical protein [Qipengyuania soli]|uniref:YcxB family protein n=1 Tax=Qipengyuania soli TaxID=2782568 RepID=A0A7S8F2D7_9SPHN|nr:hypothetical protein [Qipengyuania soli]QPC97852.1 hypothetical protein IRL76_08030 [Qipengyuania soli]